MDGSGLEVHAVSLGTLFVVGDVEETLRRSRQLLLDPLYGHPRDLLHVARPDLRETVKELAQLDGAFLIVRVFGGGAIRAEIIPELFLMSREGLFTPDAAVRQLPEAGITLAVADEAV